jgi:hypothetical protein
MNRKWILLIIAALFILTNIATFLFAQGRLGVVGKALNIMPYSAEDRITLDAPREIDENKSYSIKAAEDKKAGYRDFDDSGRYIINNKDKRSGAGINQNPPVGKSDNIADASAGQTKDSPKQEIAIAVAYPSADNISPAPNQSHYNTISNESNPVIAPEVAKEDEMPVPRLPAIDNECEADSEDDSEIEGIPLPQLPDTA